MVVGFVFLFFQFSNLIASLKKALAYCLCSFKVLKTTEILELIVGNELLCNGLNPNQ